MREAEWRSGRTDGAFGPRRIMAGLAPAPFIGQFFGDTAAEWIVVRSGELQSRP